MLRIHVGTISMCCRALFNLLGDMLNKGTYTVMDKDAPPCTTASPAQRDECEVWNVLECSFGYGPSMFICKTIQSRGTISVGNEALRFFPRLVLGTVLPNLTNARPSQFEAPTKPKQGAYFIPEF